MLQNNPSISHKSERKILFSTFCILEDWLWLIRILMNKLNIFPKHYKEKFRVYSSTLYKVLSSNKITFFQRIFCPIFWSPGTVCCRTSHSRSWHPAVMVWYPTCILFLLRILILFFISHIMSTPGRSSLSNFSMLSYPVPSETTCSLLFQAIPTVVYLR